MTGWSNATSSNALPLIPASAVATPKPKTKTAIALKTTVNFTVVVVLSLLVVFVEMVLICVALFSNNTVQNTNNSSSLFWTYSQSNTIGGNNKTTYALTPYGLAVIIIGCLLLLAFAYLAYAWFHDEVKNVSGHKTLWSCLLGSALAFFSICVIVGLVAASVITDRYPNTLDATYINQALQINDSFGLAFVITAKDPITSGIQTEQWTITLGPSPYGAFTGAMQVVLFVTFAACATVFCFSFSRHEVVSE